jgi:hypothetical protein
MILDNLTLLYLAAVLLKQLVKKHWQEGEESFEPPVVSADEKVPYSFISIFFFTIIQNSISTRHHRKLLSELLLIKI